MKKQKKVYSKEYRDGYDAGYRKGFFDGMKEFKLNQKKIQL